MITKIREDGFYSYTGRKGPDYKLIRRLNKDEVFNITLHIYSIYSGSSI